MTGALTRTEAISESVTPPVTMEEAEQAAVMLDEVVNLKKWAARKKVGEFMGHDMQGAIMMECVINRDGLSRLRKILFKKLESKNQKIFESAARLLLELCKVHVEMAGVELQVGEIIARRGLKIEGIARAPSLGGKSNETHIHGDNVQVVIEAPSQQIDAKQPGS